MAFTTQKNIETGRKEIVYTSDSFDYIFRLQGELEAEVQAELRSIKAELEQLELARKDLEIQRNKRIKDLGPDYSPFEDDSVLEEIDDQDWELTQQIWALETAIYSLEDFLS